MKTPVYCVLTTLALGVGTSSATLVWTVGIDDNGWPAGDGGGPNASFVQEAGFNDLPGVPDSPEVNRQADDDYYFAGVYSTVLDGGTYTPVGTVAANEEAAERAFAGTDDSLRYHFNLPTSLSASDLLSVTFDANNLDGNNGPDITKRRWGVEVWFNGVKVMDEVEIYQDATSGQTNWTPGSSVGLLDDDITTPQFTLGSVNAQLGAGFDNYVELRGINHNDDGGGNWMGIDYVQLNADPIPEPSPLGLALLAGAGAFLMRRMRR